MAAPSLGQAIGLNVERRDIFAPAAKQLAVNLADIKAEKRRKAKDKEETASKFMSEMFKLNPDGLNRKVRPEAVKYYNGRMGELQTLLDNPEINQIDLLKKIDETRAGLASLRDQSTSFDSVDKLILSDPNKVPTPLRNFMSNEDLIPDLDTQTFLSAYGVDYDPESNMIRSVGAGKMDVREELIKNKASADSLMQNIASDPNLVKQNIFKIKTVTGYDPEAYLLLKPDQQSYLTNLSNVMANNPSALPTISDEILNNVFNGNQKAYAEALNKIVLDQYEKDKSQLATRADQQAAFAPKGMGELTKFDGREVPKMNVQDAMKIMATDYMLKQNFPDYVQRTTSAKELNKTAQSKGDGKEEKRVSSGDVSEEPHFTEKGLAFIEKEGLSPTEAMNIFGDANHPQNKKVMAALNGQIYASAPTVAFAPGPGEPITMKGQSVNPLRMWFNPKNNKFYLDYNIVASKESVNKSMSTKVMELSSEDMKTLRSFQNKSVQEGIAKWDSLAPSIKIKSRGFQDVRVMTTDEYAGSSGSSGGASTSSSGSSFPWGGTSTKQNPKK
jgi:hypothetical protein